MIFWGRMIVKKGPGALALVFCLFFLAFAAWGQEDQQPSVQPIGQVHFSWKYNFSAYDRTDPRSTDNDQHEFLFTRFYLGAMAQISQRISVKLILDAGFDQEAEGLKIDAKYGWVNFAIFQPLQIRAGILQTSWVSMLNWAYDYRFVQKVGYELWTYRRAVPIYLPVVHHNKPKIIGWEFEDQAYETDLGLALLGFFPEGYGSYQVGAYNGEGCSQFQDDKGKALDLRLTFAPIQVVEALRLLSLSVFVHWEKVDQDLGADLLRYAALLHYRYAINDNMRVNLGLEFDYQSMTPFSNADDHEVFGSYIVSVFGDFEFYRGAAIFARYDLNDPDTENDDQTHGYQDERWLALAGLSYGFNRNVVVAGSFQIIGYAGEITDNQGNQRDKDPERLIQAHLKFGF